MRGLRPTVRRQAPRRARWMTGSAGSRGPHSSMLKQDRRTIQCLLTASPARSRPLPAGSKRRQSLQESRRPGPHSQSNVAPDVRDGWGQGRSIPTLDPWCGRSTPNRLTIEAVSIQDFRDTSPPVGCVPSPRSCRCLPYWSAGVSVTKGPPSISRSWRRLRAEVVKRCTGACRSGTDASSVERS